MTHIGNSICDASRGLAKNVTRNHARAQPNPLRQPQSTPPEDNSVMCTKTHKIPRQ